MQDRFGAPNIGRGFWKIAIVLSAVGPLVLFLFFLATNPAPNADGRPLTQREIRLAERLVTDMRLRDKTDEDLSPKGKDLLDRYRQHRGRMQRIYVFDLLLAIVFGALPVWALYGFVRYVMWYAARAS